MEAQRTLTTISTVAELDNVRRTCFFLAGNDTDTPVVEGIPFRWATGICLGYGLNGAPWAFQLISDSYNTGWAYRRTITGGWSAWRRLANANEVPKTWVSAWTDIPSTGQLLTTNHNLNLTTAQIDTAQAFFDLKCIVARRGWAVGDILRDVRPQRAQNGTGDFGFAHNAIWIAANNMGGKINDNGFVYASADSDLLVAATVYSVGGFQYRFRLIYY
jgi:hypothetical protein